MPAGGDASDASHRVAAARAAAVVRRRALPVVRMAVVVAGVAVLVAHVAVVWLWGPHTQDGPPHLFAATGLRALLAGADGTLADLYAPNVAAGWTNLTTYPLLVVLSAALGAEVAERVLVALLVLGTGAALWYAAAGFGRDAGPVAVAGLPLTVGWAVHTGLYNFTAGVALALVAIGLHRRVVHRTDAWAVGGPAAALVAVAVSHPLALVGAYAAVVTTWLGATVPVVRRHRSLRVVAGRAGALAATVAPSVVPLVLFLLASDPVRPRPLPRDPWTALADAVLLRWQVGEVGPGDARWAAVLAIALWAGVALLVRGRIVARGGWRGHDLWAALALALGAAAVLVPDRLAGGTLVQPRVALLAVLALLLWIAGADARGAGWTVVAVGAVGAVAGAGLLQSRLAPYRAIDAATAEVLSVAPAIPRGALVLGAVAARTPGGEATAPLVHVVDRLALRAGAVPALTLDAGSGYGPIRYRSRFDPLPALRGFPRNRLHGSDLRPAALAGITARYAETTGRALDHLVLVGYDLDPTDRVDLAEAGFALVDRSGPTGLVRLYRVPRPGPVDGGATRSAPPAAPAPPGRSAPGPARADAASAGLHQ